LNRPVAVGSGRDAAQMRLNPGLAQTFPGAERELRHCSGLHAKQRSNLGRFHLLDLRVPEHLLPASRKAAERLSSQAAIEGIVGCLFGGVWIGNSIQLIDGGLSARAPPRSGGVADAGEKVRAEGAVRTAALENGVVDARVRLLDEI